MLSQHALLSVTTDVLPSWVIEIVDCCHRDFYKVAHQLSHLQDTPVVCFEDVTTDVLPY